MIKRYSLYFAWLIAMIATFGSLYYSEVENWTPCNLCWYQRIAIYPLALILGIAAYRRDKAILPYGIVLAILGLLFAFYHVLEQSVPGFSGINLCGQGQDCKVDHLYYFGFITMPMMSVAAFLAILFFLFRAKKS